MPKQTNIFQFMHAGDKTGMTVLNAVMSSFSYGRHAHEEFALGVTLEGIQEFSCQGSRFRSEPGNIILFNPGDVHDGHPGTKSALKYTMLYFEQKEFLSLLECAAETMAGNSRIPETHFVDPILHSLIIRTANLATDNRTADLEYELCLYQIARRLTQRMGVYRPDERTAQQESLLLTVRDYIHDNIESVISIDDLSCVANISKYHFIRLFRGQFGLTPHQYILNHRINRVREVLRTGTPPSQVAQTFGFFDASHMNRHFKRTFGVTPKQFQTQLLK